MLITAEDLMRTVGANALMLVGDDEGFRVLERPEVSIFVFLLLMCSPSPSHPVCSAFLNFRVWSLFEGHFGDV
jgi:hypothetical protein